MFFDNRARQEKSTKIRPYINGIQEVSGSIPLISTRKKACNLNGLQAFSFSALTAKMGLVNRKGKHFRKFLIIKQHFRFSVVILNA